MKGSRTGRWLGEVEGFGPAVQLIGPDRSALKATLADGVTPGSLFGDERVSFVVEKTPEGRVAVGVQSAPIDGRRHWG